MKHFQKQAAAAFFVKQAGIGDDEMSFSDKALYFANPSLGAANQAIKKGGWDRDSWYSWIPLVGDIGNAVSNFKDGNIWSGIGDLGLGALNVVSLGAGGALAKGALKGGAKLLGSAAKKAPGTTMGNVAKQTAGGAINTVRAGNQAANSLRTGVQNLANSGGLKGVAGKGLQKGFGGLYNMGKRNPKLTLAATAAAPFLSGGGNLPSQQIANPGYHFGGGYGGGQHMRTAGGMLDKGRMSGYQ